MDDTSLAAALVEGLAHLTIHIWPDRAGRPGHELLDAGRRVAADLARRGLAERPLGAVLDTSWDGLAFLVGCGARRRAALLAAGRASGQLARPAPPVPRTAGPPARPRRGREHRPLPRRARRPHLRRARSGRGADRPGDRWVRARAVHLGQHGRPEGRRALPGRAAGQRRGADPVGARARVRGRVVAAAVARHGSRRRDADADRRGGRGTVRIRHVGADPAQDLRAPTRCLARGLLRAGGHAHRRARLRLPDGGAARGPAPRPVPAALRGHRRRARAARDPPGLRAGGGRRGAQPHRAAALLRAGRGDVGGDHDRAHPPVAQRPGRSRPARRGRGRRGGRGGRAS